MPHRSKFEALLARLKAVTSPFGKKAELAAFLNVPMQRVSEWLSGVYKPNAETVLQLLEWVQAEEAKQNKRPERALTRPGRVTQSRKPSENENLKSDRGRQ